MSDDSNSRQEWLFEEYLRDGISAAKSGQRRQAQSLLNRAILLNSADSRPYVWLSATTDDLNERRDYLEQAVARDPNNTAAKRGLALLNGKIEASRLMPEGATPEIPGPAEQVEVQGQTFECPMCGGRTSFSPQSSRLTCEYCGYTQERESPEPPDHAEQVLDFVLPTSQGHSWSSAQMRLECATCGAISVLPPGYKTAQCPYCGSNQLAEPAGQEELVDPHVIALMKLDKKQAMQIAKAWLRKGFLTPTELRQERKSLRLRPAYYSCWVFDGTVEARWTCEVAEGSGNTKQWAQRSGVEASFFNDVLVTGVKQLPQRELESIEPFNLQEVEEFAPEYLAGWPTILYDRPLSNASLLAREKVLKGLRTQLYNRIEFGWEKRNVNLGGGNWSGIIFKHILLPVWIGAYSFRGKKYRLFINGQTGKVSGQKPSDIMKLVLTVSAVVLTLFFLLVVYWFLNSSAM